MIGTLSCVSSIYQLVCGRTVGKVALHFSFGHIGARFGYRVSRTEAIVLGKGSVLTAAIAGEFLIGRAHGTMPQTTGKPESGLGLHSKCHPETSLTAVEQRKTGATAADSPSLMPATALRHRCRFGKRGPADGSNMNRSARGRPQCGSRVDGGVERR